MKQPHGARAAQQLLLYYLNPVCMGTFFASSASNLVKFIDVLDFQVFSF